MRLVKVKLKNFRQYRDQTVYFPQNGLVGFIGKNGAGKSTLMNAIQWALYGKIRKVTKNMIKNQNVDPKEKFYVELDFMYQGQFHRIRRHEVSSKCFVQIDGLTK